MEKFGKQPLSRGNPGLRPNFPTKKQGPQIGESPKKKKPNKSPKKRGKTPNIEEKTREQGGGAKSQIGPGGGAHRWWPRAGHARGG